MAENQSKKRQYPAGISFEEFKLFFETAERVTDRRNAENKWGYSVCSASLVAVGLVCKFMMGERGLWAILSAVAILSISFQSIKYCAYWRKKILSYKELNAAKFTVLGEMVEVGFLKESGEVIESAKPFDKEWCIMQENKGSLEKIENQPIYGLRSSSDELFMPQAFTNLYILIMLLDVVYFVSAVYAYLCAR